MSSNVQLNISALVVKVSFAFPAYSAVILLQNWKDEADFFFYLIDPNRIQTEVKQNLKSVRFHIKWKKWMGKMCKSA